MVSVIIPYYNRPNKIIRCVKSVLNQSYQDFEIIIIDDNSPKTLYLDLDNRISIYKNKKNLGPGLSRNFGLEHAKGEYIAFLDSDDYWDTEFLNETMKILSKHSDLSFVFTNTLAFKSNSRKSKRKFDEAPSTILPNILTKQRSWSTSACLWNRRIIGDIRFINSRNWEDYVFDSEVGLKNNKIRYISKNLCFYDLEGADKLSKKNHRIEEKTYSLITLFKILKSTKYIQNNNDIHLFFKKQMITSLEYYRKFNFSKEDLEIEIIDAIKYLTNYIEFILIKSSYRFLPINISIKVLNRLKKIRN